MTLDDGTVFAIACAVVGALSGAVAWLWKAMDKRYQLELAKRDKEIADLVGRVRKLEDERVPTQIQHAAKIEELTNRYDATAARTAEALNNVAKALREVAANSNAQTEAMRSMRCKAFNQEALPEPHPAGKGTDAITARNREHA